MRARTRTDLASHAQRTQQTINPDVRAAQSWANMSLSKPNPREQCSHARALANFTVALGRPAALWDGGRALRTTVTIITIKRNYQKRLC